MQALLLANTPASLKFYLVYRGIFQIMQKSFRQLGSGFEARLVHRLVHEGGAAIDAAHVVQHARTEGDGYERLTIVRIVVSVSVATAR